MTQEAWIFMMAMWTLIAGNTGYCFYKLLSSQRRLDGDEEGSPSR